MIFTIKKGKHYSNLFLYKTLNLINFRSFNLWTVTFNETCKYEFSGEDSFDINKLIGVSLGFDHHKESARFGWRSIDGQIELSAYTYTEGIRKTQTICTVPLNIKVDLFLDAEGDYYRFVTVSEDFHREIKIRKKVPFSIGYSLWPYFGGNRPAPHDIQIELT